MTTSPPNPAPLLRELALNLAALLDHGWSAGAVRDHLTAAAHSAGLIEQHGAECISDVLLSAHGLLCGVGVDEAGLLELWGPGRYRRTLSWCNSEVLRLAA